MYVDLAVKEDFFLEAMTGLPGYGSLLVPGNGIDVFNVIRNYNYCAGFGVALIDKSGPANSVDVKDGAISMEYNRKCCG